MASWCESWPSPCDSRRALIRCVYTDLDGTLLGPGASLFRDAEGAFTLLPARALEACFRADVEVVLKSGRRKAQVMEDARLIGQASYIYEMGCGLVIDGEESMLVDSDLQPRDGRTTHDLIEESGAPRLLFDSYPGRLEYHDPWHVNREISHLMRGLVNAMEADRLLAEHGHADLRLVDNGVIAPKPSLTGLEAQPHVYHLIPRGCSKADAVARHMQSRGFDRSEVIAVGDSREDLGVADVVGRFFLVANGLEKDPGIREAIAGRANVEVTEGRNGEGVYEAIVRSLAESR
jgi:hydroxymethylpyrimidine pyrophosphatase-like HAD family hydrolase